MRRSGERRSGLQAAGTLALAVAAFAWTLTLAGGGSLAAAADESPDCGEAGALTEPTKKTIAMKLVSSAENSSLDWRPQYRYLEYKVEGNRAENRGYTGGTIGFTSRTGDMLELLRYLRSIRSHSRLASYIPALRRASGTTGRQGLGAGFRRAWRAAANKQAFRQGQDHERDLHYFCPAIRRAQRDGLGALGQFIYYDAIVVHGPGADRDSFGGIRGEALGRAGAPAEGGEEQSYLNAFLDVRRAAMRRESAHEDTSRVDTAQRVFLDAGNLELDPPLQWSTYGDRYSIPQ